MLFQDIEDAIQFLEDAKDRLKKNTDALYLLDISQAEKKLALGLHHDCIEKLEKIRSEVEEYSDIDPKVFSTLAHVFGLYYRRKEDHENYYKSCLQYLAYTPMSEMSEKEKKDLSIKVGMSILMGKNVFNIIELLDKEILNSLLGTEHEWVFFLLKALGTGNINEFNHCVDGNKATIQKFKNVAQEMQYLEQKVRIIAFLEMIFKCGKDERSIPFDKIASACQVDSSDVELLVMKAMSLNLIQGQIDEVAQIVEVEWCQPRYLSKDHLMIMSKQIIAWEEKMDHTIKMMENNSVELVNS